MLLILCKLSIKSTYLLITLFIKKQHIMNRTVLYFITVKGSMAYLIKHNYIILSFFIFIYLFTIYNI